MCASRALVHHARNWVSTQLAVDGGVLPALASPPEYVMIDVIGKTPDDVCDVIVNHVGGAAETGCVIVLCGLSGTGKGTTVAKLQERLPNTVTWSNGNVFRALTLLAVTWCEQQVRRTVCTLRILCICSVVWALALRMHPRASCPLAACAPCRVPCRVRGIQGKEEFDPELTLTPENLQAFMGMLTFDKFEGTWDIKISGLGIDTMVAAIKNTELKGPKVSKNIPTVARHTQGQVVGFAADATKKMGEDGLNVCAKCQCPEYRVLSFH